MLIDTHTHLYLPEFEEDGGGAQAVRRAMQAGVQHMIFPNVDLDSIVPMQALSAQFPGKISMAMGYHPTEIKDNWRQCVAQTADLLDAGGYVAVGEVGIDMYWDKTYEAEQMLAFDQQVAHAERLGLPVIIHCRDGLDQTLEILQEHPTARAVFHSFGGTEADVEYIRRVGDYYFGINGIVTFKNCKVRDVLPAITTSRLLLETDSPYLAPVPYRGKRNESAYLLNIANHIAQSMSLSLSDLSALTTQNAIDLFGIGPA